ncbi:MULTISPECIES: thiamine-phosphate kinase [unclassified Arcicella]|uniref:thiamine-phosphate kinase n=1 Tax=unclassified Arcicella TaxID=2644986 RepID=UPI002854E434|nr:MULTISPECIES: thiamine-phosphate kinase [unclassified Arcicella]MDR6560709.1 thiamine-monophosphate kinase [Arcicella sp. BE51]MDR6810593.1 thiamine-monophosphate kinase [Arcicella sp. BE140]MDR6821943.1 thiamine-monophosphate kinase [Arcicella sp. BE139]
METRTELSTIGEFGLIKLIDSKFQNINPETIKGIGDDAAIIDTAGKELVVSTDLLMEGVHFDLAYTPLKHLGYKAVAVNVSDIAAMNAIPKQITVSLGLSNRFSVEAIEELYEGIKIACDEYKVDLVGGDTSASRAGLVISITALGTAEKKNIVLRNTAKTNDIICVSGDLGAALIGLQTLEREKQVFLANPDMQPQLDKDKDYVIERQLKPNARMDVIYELRDLGVVPTSMIDVSDGLASELLHLCKNSGTGAVIFEDKIPIDDQTYLVATELNFSPMTAALNGGEDYELLFTVKQEDFETIKNMADISFLGYMTNDVDGVKLMMKSGTLINVTSPGFEHF